MSELITQYQTTGPCTLDIDLLEKLWDHRFMLYDYENTYRFIKYLRRGSGCTEIKCDISNEQAQEIITRLKLVRTRGISPVIGTWRKEGMSEFDMRRLRKK
jgi:hypothetical protein